MDDSDDEDVFYTHGLCIPADPDWYEMERDEAEGDDLPMVLQKGDSHAVLQFSVPPPKEDEEIMLGDLRDWMEEMAKRARLGKAVDQVETTGPNLVCAGTFTSGKDFTRLWYWSDRKRVVMVTYACRGKPDPEELSDCERMVQQMRFENPEAE